MNDQQLTKMQRRSAHKSIFQLTVLSLVILCSGGGIALLFQLAATHYSLPHAGAALNVSSNQDADLSVVGQPSLPAATVDVIFSHLGSPMVGTGKVIEQVASQEHIDDAFDTDFSVLLREVQEPPRQAAAATIQPSAANVLPAGIDYMIVTFALLLALLIAAWGLRIGGSVPTSVEKDLGIASTSILVPIDHRSTGKNFPLRRTILLPSLPDTGALENEPILTPIGAGSHSAGLLSRYRETQQG